MKYNLSIRTKIALSMFLILTSCFLVGILAIKKTLMDRFIKLEDENIRTDVTRLAEVVSDQINTFDKTVTDWSSWDDAYFFMEGKSPTFAEQNFLDSVPDSLTLDTLRFYSNENQYIGGVDRVSEDKNFSYTEFFNYELPKHRELFLLPEDGEKRSGVVQLSGRSFYFSAKGIRKSSGEAPSIGTMMMLKEINDAFITKTAALTKLKITATKFESKAQNSSAVKHDIQFEKIEHINSGNYFAADKETIYAEITINDANKIPLLIFSFLKNRALISQGQATTYSVGLTFLATGLLSVLLLWIFISNLIVKKVTLLSEEVQEIGKNGENKRVTQSSKDELGILSKCINSMLDIIDAQNKGMRDIVTNVKTGFLSIGKDGKIKAGFTDYCAIILGKNLGEKNLAEALFSSAKDQLNFDAFIEQVFDDILPDDFTLSQLPSRIELTNGKIIKLEGTCIRKNDFIESIIFTISDITKLEEAEKSNREANALIKILSSIGIFASFKESVRATINSITKNPNHLIDQTTIRRSLHTIKGNLGSFGLIDFANTIHNIEGEQRIDISHIEKIENEFIDFLNRYYNVLNIQYDQAFEQLLTTTRKEALNILKTSETWSETEKLAVTNFVEKMLLTPFNEIAHRLIQDGERISKKLGKNIKFELRGENVLVDNIELFEVFGNLLHAIRNAIDHGIETNEERKQKNEIGKITISSQKLNDGFTITISDNGRGITAEQIKHAAIRKKLLSEKQALDISDKDAINLIFLDGFSTKESSTEISGRGVGMSSLKSAVESANGRLTIDTTQGIGTSITIEFKKQIKIYKAA